jgi:hypothetical protein
MDKAKIEKILDRIIELDKRARIARDEFYSLKEHIQVAQSSLRFKSVKFVYKGMLFEFDDDADLCSLDPAFSLDNAMSSIDTDSVPTIRMYTPKNMLENE